MDDLSQSTQDILDGREFTGVHNQIERATRGVADPLVRLRLQKLPFSAAMAHLAAMRAIRLIQDGLLPTVAPESSAYQRYLALTSGVDHVASEGIVAAIDNLGPHFTAAYQHYATIMDALRVFRQGHPQAAARRGKTGADNNETPSYFLRDQQAGNAASTTPGRLVREVMRICLREQRLPDRDALGQELTSYVPGLVCLTRLSGQVFNHLLNGATVARRQYRALQRGVTYPVPGWDEIVRLLVEEDELHPLAHDLAVTLSRPALDEFALAEQVKQDGMCGAQFALYPHERPGRPLENHHRAHRYFTARGISLTDGRFISATYSFVRGIEVGLDTIFTDDRYQAAFELLPHLLRTETLTSRQLGDAGRERCDPANR